MSSHTCYFDVKVNWRWEEYTEYCIMNEKIHMAWCRLGIWNLKKCRRASRKVLCLPYDKSERCSTLC